MKSEFESLVNKFVSDLVKSVNPKGISIVIFLDENEGLGKLIDCNSIVMMSHPDFHDTAIEIIQRDKSHKKNDHDTILSVDNES